MRTPLLLICIYGLYNLCSGQQTFSNDILSDPRKYSKEFEAKFVYKEVSVYSKNPKEKSVFLKNGYAGSILQTPIPWPLRLKQYYVKEIKVIFTKYPIDKNFWNTNYYDLLAARLQSAFAIDGRLNDVSISYSLILQTGCKSEEEAKTMLHAIEIVYEIGERKVNKDEVEEPDFIDSLYINADSLAWVRDMNKANKFFKKSKATDTVVLKGMDLYKLTDSLLVVIDVTGSMAPYYSQVSLWAARNFYPGHYYVLFNDGGSRSLPLGQTGGYEEGRVRSSGELIKFLRHASGTKGNNREFPENDIEGLLVGIDAFPDNKGVILVADNPACIRDYKLLLDVSQPIHIIPCGGTVLNPQYLNLAWYTGGSVFWLDQTIKDWDTLCNGEIFTLGDIQYRFIKSKRKFETLDKNGNHHDFCDFYTPPLKKKKRKN
jgi:hypothetical protein